MQRSEPGSLPASCIDANIDFVHPLSYIFAHDYIGPLLRIYFISIPTQFNRGDRLGISATLINVCSMQLYYDFWQIPTYIPMVITALQKVQCMPSYLTCLFPAAPAFFYFVSKNIFRTIPKYPFFMLASDCQVSHVARSSPHSHGTVGSSRI